MWAMSCESNKTTVKPNCDNVTGNGETCPLLISFCKFLNHTLWLTPPFHLHANMNVPGNMKNKLYRWRFQTVHLGRLHNPTKMNVA